MVKCHAPDQRARRDGGLDHGNLKSACDLGILREGPRQPEPPADRGHGGYKAPGDEQGGDCHRRLCEEDQTGGNQRQNDWQDNEGPEQVSAQFMSDPPCGKDAGKSEAKKHAGHDLHRQAGHAFEKRTDIREDCELAHELERHGRHAQPDLTLAEEA